MSRLDFHELDVNVARARIVLSLVAMLSLYVDPSTSGGLFHLTGYALTTLLCHLAYSLAVYFAQGRLGTRRGLQAVSTGLDLFFAAAIAVLTEGQTSPSYVFFVFAIIAVGIRAGLRPTIAVTVCSVTLYLLVIAFSDGLNTFYSMRAVYLAIAGYLIGFFGQQRAIFEARARELETRAERHLIGRSLHDGYVQALAGVNLRLETCRELLSRKQPEDALAQIAELQNGVAREYDEVRTYVRSLAGIDPASPGEPRPAASDPRLQVRATFAGRCSTGEHILQIMLEGLRNTRRHGMATQVTISAAKVEDKLLLTIDDDGVGFPDSNTPPWAIASRVAELGGHLSVNGDGPTRLEIEMPNA
jgi:signal transduction histidine kinase